MFGVCVCDIVYVHKLNVSNDGCVRERDRCVMIIVCIFVN